jgi:ribosomal-protein-serine acetyltransferase
MFALRIREDCELKLVEERHALAIFSCVDRHRKTLRKWLPWVDASVDVDYTRNFIRNSLVRFAEDCSLQAGLWIGGDFAGMAGYAGVDWMNHCAEFGYWLAPCYEGRGLITDSCRALLGHAFGDLGLNRVVIRCATDNAKSRAIPQRLGFQEEGVARQAQYLHGRYVDLAIYSLLAHDWASGQQVQRTL